MHAGFFLDRAFLIPLVPAVTFWVILLFGRRWGSRAAYVGIGALAIDWLLSVGALVQWIHRIHGDQPASPVVHTVTWFQSSGIKLTVGTQMDGLAVMMCFVVATISLLVHIYS